MEMSISKDVSECKISPKLFNIHTCDPAILLQGNHFTELLSTCKNVHHCIVCNKEKLEPILTRNGYINYNMSVPYDHTFIWCNYPINADLSKPLWSYLSYLFKWKRQFLKRIQIWFLWWSKKTNKQKNKWKKSRRINTKLTLRSVRKKGEKGKERAFTSNSIFFCMNENY